MGDSKTTNTGWTTKLTNALTGMSNWTAVSEKPTRLATAGWTVSDLEGATDAWTTAATDTPNVILVNIGVNDSALGTSQAVFEAKLGSLLDKIHAKWANAIIFVCKVWRGDTAPAEALCDTIDDTYIVNVLATRVWASNGLDERLVIRDPDHGVTKTNEGVHYNAAGETALAEAHRAKIETTL